MIRIRFVGCDLSLRTIRGTPWRKELSDEVPQGQQARANSLYPPGKAFPPASQGYEGRSDALEPRFEAAGRAGHGTASLAQAARLFFTRIDRCGASWPAINHEGKSLIDSSTGWPLRSHLILYGLSIVVPVLAFAGLLFVQFERSERMRLEERVRDVAANVSVDIDREIENVLATLAALAASPSLQTGDLPAFREQARKVLRATGSNIVLRDLTGQQLVNTRVPPDAVLPRVASCRSTGRCLKRGGP